MASDDSPANGQTVLLVEDDRGLRESLATVLAYQGLDVVQASSAEDAAPLIEQHDPQLVVLDVNLPGRDGISLLRDLRLADDDRPVLLLTARHEVADRVAGLDAGADDYLPKPFALEELLARTRTLLRRSVPRAEHGASSGALPSLSIGSLHIEQGARRVTSNGVEIVLTRLEYELLVLLVEHADQVLTRAVIHERVWGYDEEFGSNTLDVTVSSLRRKLHAAGADRVIHTVRGVGYVARASQGAPDTAHSPRS